LHATDEEAAMPERKPWDWPFHTLATGPVADRVYAVRTRAGVVNMYVYVAGEALIAVDSGAAAPQVRREWAKLPLRIEAVAAVFLTHGDRDHIGGLACFPQAQVFLSAEEEPLVARRQPRFFGRLYGPRLDRSHTALADGQVISIGDTEVRAIATPGHTPGSMSYLVDDRVLFAGDTLTLSDGRIVPFLRVMNMDSAREEESIRKLASLEGVELLCTGHSGCAQDWERAVEPWLP
jgi:glyoxylase-like metal-dependent hydrolase (beta-lactamase superfamily II)